MSTTFNNKPTYYPTPGQFVSRSRCVIDIDKRDIDQPLSQNVVAFNFDHHSPLPTTFPTYPEKPYLPASQSLNFDLPRSESKECESFSSVSSQNNICGVSDMKLVGTILMEKERVKACITPTLLNDTVDTHDTLPVSCSSLATKEELILSSHQENEEICTNSNTNTTLLEMTHDYFIKQSWKEKSKSLIKRKLPELKVAIDQAQRQVEMNSLHEILPQMENQILFQDSFQSRAGTFMEVRR